MFEVFAERGRELASARALLASDPGTFPSSLALVSIHAAIAFNDAVQIHLSGTYSKGSSHERAGENTQKLCKTKGLSVQGVQHLSRLLSRKTAYSYGENAVTEEQAISMQIASERFEAWAENTLKETK